MPQTTIRFLAILLVTFLMAGCSSSEDEFVPLGTSPGAEGSPATVGRVVLTGPVAKAGISAFGPQGQSLAPEGLETDQNGLFFLQNSLPPGSRVIAQVPAGAVEGTSESLTLQATVGPDDGGRVLLNYPVHLVSLLLAKQPGLTHQEAVARVERLFSISTPWRLGTVEESALSPFYHGVFFQEAAKAGGVETLTAQLLEDPALAQTLSQDKGPGGRTFTVAALGDGDIFGDIVSNVIDGGVGLNIVGWGVAWFTKGLTTTDPFAGIPGELLNLQNTLTQYSEAFLKEQTLQTLSNQVTTPITTAAQNLSVAASTFQPPSPPFSLYALGSDALAMTLEGIEYEKILVVLFQTLTGNAGLYPQSSDANSIAARPERILASQIYPIVGVDSILSDRFGGYGAFSNYTVAQVTNLHDYYLQYGTLTCQLLSENAHATVDTVVSPVQNLAQACRAAQDLLLESSPDLPGVASRRKQVGQLTPGSLGSSMVFVDREYGLIWYTEAMGGLTYSQANSTASSLQVGGYTSGWRLPYTFELDQLRTRMEAGWLKRTAGQRQGQQSSVLADLGFDLSKLSSDHYVWCNGPLDFRSLSKFIYDLDNGSVSEFLTNIPHNALFVRSYLEPQPELYFSDGELMPASGTSLEVVAEDPDDSGNTQMSAQMVFDCPIGGNFTISGKTITPVYGNESFSDLSPPFDVQSITGSALGSEQLKDITTRVIWSSSNDDKAYVSNVEGEEGKVYWRQAAQVGDTVTITASFGGIQGSRPISAPNQDPSEPSPWQVSAIILSPDQAGVSFDQNASLDIFFVATLFTENSATGARNAYRSSWVGGEDGAPAVTWSLEDADGNPVPAPSGFADPQNSTLRLDKASLGSDPYVVVKATSGGVTVSTKLYIDQN